MPSFDSGYLNTEYNSSSNVKSIKSIPLLSPFLLRFFISLNPIETNTMSLNAMSCTEIFSSVIAAPLFLNVL